MRSARHADGKIVVHHNRRLKNSGGPISEITLERLRRLAQNRGFHLPTVEETLRQTTGRIALDLELKESGYEAEVVAVAGRFFDLAHVLFTSFDADSIRRLKELSVPCQAGLLLGLSSVGSVRADLRAKSVISRLQSCRADYALVHWRMLTKKFHQRLHEAGIPIIAWTVDRSAIAQRLIKRSVTGIITNFPEKLLPLVSRRDQTG